MIFIASLHKIELQLHGADCFFQFQFLVPCFFLGSVVE